MVTTTTAARDANRPGRTPGEPAPLKVLSDNRWQRDPGERPDDLTPFVDALCQKADREIRAMLGCPRQAELSWMSDGADRPLRISVSLRGLTMQFALRPADPDAPGAWSDGEVDLLAVPLTTQRGLTLKAHGRWLRSLGARAQDGTLSIVPAERAAREAWAYREIEDRVLRNIERTTGGVIGMLRLGFRCNQDCGFCWQARDWPGPPEELYTTWIDEFAARGVRTLTFSGGEPTLHRGLPELIARAHKVHGMTVTLQSNVIRLKRLAYAQKLKDAGVDSVLVSLHGPTADISDRLTRAPGTHVRTIAGLENALEVGLRVGMNCVVEKENAHTLDALAELIVARFVKPYPNNPVVCVNYSQPSDYYDPDRYRDQIAPLDDVRGPLTRAAAILRAANVVVAANGTCGFPICVFKDAPQFADPPPKTAMDPRHLSSRSNSRGVCADCAVAERCAGARESYRARFGEEGLSPFEVIPSNLGAG